MTYIDSHAHVFSPEFLQDREEMLQRALDAHVAEVYMPNIDLASIPAMLEIEKNHPWCHALLGLHPCHVFQDYKEVLAEMEEWLERRPFKGIGETGLDYYWDKTFVQEQKEALRIQCGWAKRLQIPIVLHTRDAFPDTLEIIREQQDGTLRGIFHCFSGSVEEAQAAVDVNFLLGIGGVSTFKNGGLEPVLQAIDLKHIVLETDSPYLAPVPKRGRRNEPAYLPYVAARISEIKSCTLDEVAAVTTANAQNLFA
ncbi:TatD family hydrolase [Rufibacter glacialis]|uniref:TatD family deoxyribonuclease n=1 Tax=Rufibacter glacialis TaxID=1259555 RepID=A0A5M8QA86_9BACT|nr:TatD family hydrolase [Rufibacter glacialis]KAA6431746.1 TatD family deoxyribonuclease [Rufibacter glacialis]GGK81949.1 TatD family hydrolase [Rufibacter glacialis]